MAVFKPQDIFAGRYQLQKLLGLGGFSEVWQVTDQMAENTVVALKIYAAGAGLDEDGIELFRREYSLTLPLNHKNLLKPTYFDIAEGSPYLVMPLCAKGSLTKKLFRQGTLSEAELALMMSHVADGLAYLHQRAPVVLHQDIKPDNVLITAKDDFLLSDFGISSRMRHTMMRSTRSTASSNSLTIAYAPPEKFTSRPKSMPASDVFSFGVMLYELCTNEVPWMGHGGQSLLTGSAVPEIPEQFSPELSQIVQACMDVNPALRPTAEQLHQLTLVYLEKGKWEGFEEITNYKETIYPAQAGTSAAHSQTIGEGAGNDDANIPHRGTEAHPELNLDGAIADDDEDNAIPVVRSERVTEAVDTDKRKKKALAAPPKRTFTRNVYLFLGVIMLTLIVLIAREYKARNHMEQTSGLNDMMLAKNKKNTKNKKPKKTTKNEVNVSVTTGETKAKDGEETAHDEELDTQDLQEKLRMMEEKLKRQNKKLEEREKSKQPSGDFEVFEEKENENFVPPVPPVSPEPSVIISENGIIIDNGKNRKGGKNEINLNLPKEIIAIVKDAAKHSKNKKQMDEWSKKMSKKYEKLGKKYAEEYERKMKAKKRAKARARAHNSRSSHDNHDKYIYKEKYPSGYLVQRHNGLWGYLDRKGNEIISPRYERAWPFYEGLAAVRRHGKWGYIDKTGRTVISHKYDRPGHFSHGKAKVTRHGKRFYINRYGKCVKDCP